MSQRRSWLVVVALLLIAACTGPGLDAPPPSPPPSPPTSPSPSPASVALTEDPSLPVPSDVRAYGDDRVITVTWAPVDDERVVGYYVSYQAAGADEVRAIQTQARRGAYGEAPTAVQLQPVDNGVEYEIRVQAVAGTYEHFPTGPLDAHADDGPRVNAFARADGRVSPVATGRATPSPARVDQLRSRLTGFFDDFNLPAGPFDETKWNQAATACVAPGTAAAFVNNQFHVHNMLRSDCDRAGLVSRPRAVFDTTGASPAAPASIAIDLDGTTAARDTWYLDLIPTTTLPGGAQVDLTAHNDLFDEDTQGPGTMLRINARFNDLSIAYYDAAQQPHLLDPYVPDPDRGETVCARSGDSLRIDYATCDMTRKVPGLSPLPEPSLPLQAIANVRRHWLVQLDGARLTLFVDSSPVARVGLPAEFVAEQTYTVHSTAFSYNTGKSYAAPGGDQIAGIGPPLFGAMPYTQMVHWDNFGFSGPAATVTVANYLEGGASGTRPYFSTGSNGELLPAGNRTTIIAIPDPIADGLAGPPRLMFTVQPFGDNVYAWDPDDHVLINGHRYAVPDPDLARFAATVQDGITPRVFVIEVDAEHLATGSNTVQFVLDGADTGGPADTLNVHLELPRHADAGVAYTTPLELFGDRFRAVIQPGMTNCDQYNVVEQDLGLPYPDGRANLRVGECVLADHTEHRPR